MKEFGYAITFEQENSYSFTNIIIKDEDIVISQEEGESQSSIEIFIQKKVIKTDLN